MSAQHPDDAKMFLEMRLDLTPDQRMLWDAWILALTLGHALVVKGVLTLAEVERAGHAITDDHGHIAQLVRTLRRDLPDDDQEA